MYVLGKNLPSIANTNLNNLEIMYARLSCNINVINGFTETFFRFDINMSLNILNDQIESCMSTESNYQTNIVQKKS